MLRNVRIRSFKSLNDVELRDCGSVNVLIGKNNSGKSSILHAIDMAGLALSVRNWEPFPLKLRLEDLFSAAGNFAIELVYQDDWVLTIRTHEGGTSPVFDPSDPGDDRRFQSILVLPDTEVALLRRQHQTPANVMSYMEQRRVGNVSGADILYALRFYATRGQRGFSQGDYDAIISDVREFFPDLEGLESDRTEQDVATVVYREHSRDLDLVYAGAGLKHFLDMIVKTKMSQADIVLIDEPEMGLHPDLQRKLIEYFRRRAEENGQQFFVATHSAVFIADPDSVTVYRVENRRGERKVSRVPPESLHSLWGDLGIRPSDFLQHDIVVMVEGAKDVAFMEHVLHELYGPELDGVSVGVLQYAGSAADGIVSGSLDLGNVCGHRGYVLWLRDRDAAANQDPDLTAERFRQAVQAAGQMCHIWRKREIEFYLPLPVFVEAVSGDQSRVGAVRAALSGHGDQKFTHLAPGCTPSGEKLRQLLARHVTKENLEAEVRELVEQTVLVWRREILGL